MRWQRGFILPTGLTLYAAIGAAAIIGLLSVALKVQSYRLEAVKVEYAAFASGVEQIGKLAVAANKLKETEDKLKKEKADHENAIAKSALASVTKRLSEYNSRKSFLPAASAGTSRPDLSCFDRAELDAALREFSRETSAIAIEGESATIDLDTGKSWVTGLYTGSPADSGR